MSAPGWLRRARTCRALWAALALLSGVLVLSSCGGTAKGDLPPLPRVADPQPGIIPKLAPYKVQVGDVLDIRLLLNPELDEEEVVRPDGMISTTVAEDVPAYGKTPSQISTELRDKYSSTLKNPEITVVVHSFAPNRIYVGGEVVNPGEFVSVGPNLTISQAIARAGGLKLSGDRAEIFVIRRGPNDTPEAFSVAYKDVISGNDPAADARLANYDMVYVPRTGVAEVYTWFNQFVQQFIPLNWGFSYNINPVSSTGH